MFDVLAAGDGKARLAAGDFEAELALDVERRGIVEMGAAGDGVGIGGAEIPGQRSGGGLGGIATPPMRFGEPVAEFGFEADNADQAGIVPCDGKGPMLGRGFRKAEQPVLGILLSVGERHFGEKARDVEIVETQGDGRGVLHTGRSERQSLC